MSMHVIHYTAQGSPCSKSFYQGDCKPDKWHEHYPECGHSSQSAININTLNTTYAPELQTLRFNNYEERVERIWFNNLVRFTLFSPDLPMTIQGGPLLHTYKFIAASFHWGENSDRGSEHTINGKSYPFEMQLRHYNGLNDAENNYRYDYAIIAILFELTAEGEESEVLEPIIKNLHRAKKHGARVDVGIEWVPRAVLPSNITNYYTYNGSLSAPPCHENVTWIVLKQTMKISAKQLDRFRSELEDYRGLPLVDNFRPTQPLNGRTVRASFKSSSSIVPQ